MLLPDDVSPYKSTPTFTEETVPAGLLNDHSTKGGTWGLLTVEQGSLLYVITEPGFEEEHTLQTGSSAVITPTHKHHIKPLGSVSFHVVFYR
jgi:tellurite resistance-related uncharacterized protein